jgi:hypothetical protein
MPDGQRRGVSRSCLSVIRWTDNIAGRPPEEQGPQSIGLTKGVVLEDVAAG